MVSRRWWGVSPEAVEVVVVGSSPARDSLLKIGRPKVRERVVGEIRCKSTGAKYEKWEF